MRNPFPGLRPFREDEEYLFFGRESQVDAMVDKLAATHFLAVVGTSGNGKSSLVNCGLRPALHGGLMARAGTSWRMAQFRPGGDPLRAMAHALAEDGVLFRDYQGEGLTLAEIVDTTLRMSKLGLIDIYEQARLGKDDNLLVVVDQFEELFRYRQLGAGGEANVYGVSEEATAFVNLLLEAEDQTTHPIYVVLTMRSDFLGDCAQFPGLAEAINAGQYLVPRMTRDERRAAIAGPVGVGEAEISPLLLTRLVNDVGDNPDQLSILQHALNRTWARWEHEGGGEGPLDLAHYEDIGSMAHALDQHAEKAYDELGTARQRQICEKVFKALTDKATDSRGVRRPTTLGTLCALADATPSEVTEVIDVFRKPSRSFLMPPAGNTLEAETVIDISHESLMRVWQRLDTWADEEARAAQGYRRLANTAVLHAAGEASLWRDPDLQMALNWREHSEPNEVWARRYHPEFQSAMHFLEASVATREAEEKEKKEQSQRELTRARRIALGAAAFSLLLIVVAGFAWRQMSIAENLATTAELREKAALVKELLPEEPLKALVLAIQATGKSQSALGGEVLPRVESSLLSALQVAEWSNVFKAHEGQVTSLTTTRDGMIVSGSDDGTVRLWDRDGKPIGEQPLSADEDYSMVTSVAISSDANTIVSGKDDGTAWLWDRPSGKMTRLEGHEYTVSSVATTPDGKTFVSGSHDGSVRLWNHEGKPIGKQRWSADEEDSMVTSVAISSDGKTIVSGKIDGTVWLWDREGGKVTPLKGHENWVNSVAITPDGKTIVSGSDDGTVRLWDREGAELIATLKGHEDWVISVAITPDGRTIVSGSHDGSVRLWNHEGKPIGEPRRHEGQVTALAISPDGKTIVSGSSDGNLWLRARENDTMGRPLAEQTALTSVAISPNGKTIVGGSDDGSVRLWTRDGKPIGKQPLSADEDYSMVTSVAISSDGKTIVSGTYDGTAWLWDRAGGKMTRLGGHEDWVNSVAITPDGKTIVSGSDDGTVRLWDRDGKNTGKQSLSADEDYSMVTSVAISSDGNTIVSGTYDGTVWLWDREGGKMTRFEGYEDWVNSVAITPDGKTIVSGSDDGTVRVWNLEDSRIISKRTLRGYGKSVTSVAFSPDGEYIVSGGADTTVRLWDRNGNPMGNPFKPFKGKTDFKGTPDRERGADGTDGSAPADAKPADVTIVAFSADGRDIVTVSLENRRVWLWQVGNPREKWIERACARVRNHEVLVEPDNGIAKEISEEADEKAVQEVVKICVGESGGWMPDQRVDFLVRQGRASAREGNRDDVEKAVAAFREAQKLDADVDLNPDTTAIDQEPEAVARKLAAPAKVWEGYQLAQEGDVEGAIAALKEAKKLDPGIDLDPNTPDIDQEPEAVARKLAAPAKVWEGYQLAQEGDVEGAIAALKEAKKLDPGIDLDPNTPDIDQDPKAVARKLAAPAKVWGGYQLAQEGDVEGAIATLREAQKLDPGIDLDPNTPDIDQDPKAVAENFAAAAKVWEGYELAQEGDVEGAIAALKEAKKLDPGIDLDPDTEDIDQDPKAVAKNFAAAAKVWEGYELAQEGDVEGAIAALREAQKFDPGIDLDPDTEDIDQDPKAVAKNFAAAAMVWEGYELAQEGDVEGTIAALREAQKLDPGIDLDPDTEDIEKNPEAVAKNFAAAAMVWEGYELAQEGDVEGAIAAFREAQKFDPGIDLDPTTDDIDQDPEAVAKSLVAPAMVWEGYELAAGGNVDEAIAAFREAQKLDPGIDLDPDTPAIDRDSEAVAKNFAAAARVWEGYQLAQVGDIEGAIAAFREAQKLDPGIDLDPDTPAIDRDSEAVAKNFAAAARVWEGYQLAQVGDIEGAIAAFREAQKLDPDVDLDPDTPAIDRDPEAVAQQLAAKAKVWEGYQLAEEGDVKRAIAAFSEAQKLDPDVDLDPDTEDIEQNPEAVAQHLATRATAQEE